MSCPMSGMNNTDSDNELKEFKKKFKEKFPHLYKGIKSDKMFREIMVSKYYDEVMS